MKSKNEPVQMQIIFEVSIFRKRKKKKKRREKNSVNRKSLPSHSQNVLRVTYGSASEYSKSMGLGERESRELETKALQLWGGPKLIKSIGKIFD